MEPLPYIDEHSLPIDAPPEVVWSALSSLLYRQMNGSARFARMLGCDPAQGSESFTGRPGEAVPGFRVVEAEPGRRLALRGRHRFADYQLTFIIENGQLRAESRGRFPGVLGRLYRTAVISSGGHRLITRGMLHRVARAAEKAQTA